MCVIALSFHPEKETNKLLVIANRDEYYARPSQDADWWCSTSSLNDVNDGDEAIATTLGGRDMTSGGTWLAVNKDGRFAAVTNYSFETVAGKYSRGQLVSDFLDSALPPMEYLETIKPSDYAGFNLIVYDDKSCTLAYLSNRDEKRPLPQMLGAGIYGLSNATLEESGWGKVEFLKNGLVELEKEQLVQDSEELFSLLGIGGKSERRPSLTRASFSSLRSSASSFGDRFSSIDWFEEEPSEDFSCDGIFEEDENDDLPLEKTAPFLFRPSKGYGTRCSTVVRCHQNGRWEFVERRFDESGKSVGETHEQFSSTC